MENTNYELILHRLTEISKKQDEFNKKVEDLTLELTKMKTIEHTVDSIKVWKDRFQEVTSLADMKELKEWKGKMEEQMSPAQLTIHIKEHEGLKVFKTQAMMIWVVVQGLMAIAIFWDKIFK